MSNQHDSWQNASWLDCCPWMMIFRTFGLAINPQSLLVASVGVMLTLGVWQISEIVFLGQDNEISASANKKMPEMMTAAPQLKIKQPAPLNSIISYSPIKQFDNYLLSHPFATVTRQIVGPFAKLFDPSLKFTEFAHFLCGGLLTLLIWSVAGGAITRSAVVRLACEQRVALKKSVMFALRKTGAYFTAPLFPLLGVILVALPIIILGFFTRLPWGIGFFLAGPFWIFVLLGGVLMAVMLLGVLFGWPLMWGTISTEGTDAFDALSRSYAYTFQRPLHYLFYVVLAAILGLFGWILVSIFSESVIAVSQWAASRGNSSLLIPIEDSQSEHLEYIGRWFISCWIGFVRIVATGFSYSFFWCTSAALYLLLRRDTDQTEIDEVFLDDEPDDNELPVLKTDSQGVPHVPEDSGETSSSEPEAGDEESSEDRPTDMGG